MHGPGSPRGDEAQLNELALNECLSVRFVSREDPWHLPQRLEQRAQKVKGDRYQLQALGEQLSTFDPMAKTGDGIVQLPGQIWMNIDPGAAYRT